MSEVIGVKFKDADKINYFNSKEGDIKVGDKVVAQSKRGTELGEVIKELKEDDELKDNLELRDIERKANASDLEKYESNQKEAEKAFDICLKKIKEHKLPMKLIESEYVLDKKKLLFYFTADGRIDFRELVKDLASIFRTRIELRQIGVRDETKMLGGIGKCGRELCCKTFLRKFEPISIKMAKDQDLSLNPEKISGLCGRLMCCLKYECKSYKRSKVNLPDVGDKVKIAEGEGRVIGLNVVKNTVTVNLGNKERVEVLAEKIEEKD